MSTLSAITGKDASHNAGVATQQAKQQQQLANQYGASAAQQYAGIGGEGQNLFRVGENNLFNLFSQFGNATGIGFQPNTFGGAGAGGGAAGTLNAASLQPGGGGAIQGQAQGATPGSIIGSRPGVANGGQQVGQQQGGYNPTDPYALLPYQQQQLNQLTGNIRQTGQQAIASFQQQMAASGLTDPRALQAGTQQIAEHFNAQQSEEVAKFYEDARKSKEQALQSLINEFQQISQQGLSAQEVGAGGTAGLAGAAAGQQQAQQQFSLQQQNLSNEQMGGFLNLIGAALGGGFSPVSTPPIAAPVNYQPFLDQAGVTNADLFTNNTPLDNPFTLDNPFGGG